MNAEAEPLPVGAQVELDITRAGPAGTGLAEHQGVRCKVAKVLPGERVLAEVTRRTRSTALLRPLAVQVAAPQRVPAPCPHYARCGGCQLQHLAPADQLAHKRARVQRPLAAALGPAAAALVGDVVPAAATFGYRHRNHFTADGPTLGFVDAATGAVLDLDACPLASATTAPLLAGLRRWLAASPRARELLLGATVRTGDDGALLVLVLDAARLGPDQLAADPALLALGRELPDAGRFASLRARSSHAGRGTDLLHLGGPTHVRELLGPFVLQLSPWSFAQAHPEVAAKLYARAVAWLAPSPEDPVLDLFAGSGALALHLAAAAGSVLGVEMDHRACADAAASAREHGVANVAFRAGRCEAIARKLFVQGRRFPLATVNPPRTGLPRDLVPWLPKLGIRRLVYVSCSPPTLGRDLRALHGLGFALRAVQPFDLFPQTYHVETVCLLERT